MMQRQYFVRLLVYASERQGGAQDLVRIMDKGTNDPRAERIGAVLGMIFTAALAALFLYGYLPHFL